MPETIFALSSGRPPAGIAVLRASGPAARFLAETIAGRLPEARRATLARLADPASGEAIDSALLLFFPGPASFTGEDVVEFHVHGGRAVVAALVGILAAVPGCRPAEAGEFTRRAFENGRMDLTAVEGLGDLIAAETESQRRQALHLSSGAFAAQASRWREQILRAQAYVEAELDFSEEEDLPGALAAETATLVDALRRDMLAALAAGDRGERIRDGYVVVLAGPPNAGKSTLLNAIARRDVAIVTDQPGTTRDVVEVHLDLDGYAVTLVDTAGLREAADAVEAEGIRRGRARAAAADLVLWLDEFGGQPPADVAGMAPALTVMTKADLGRPVPLGVIAVSARDETSIVRLVELITAEVSQRLAGEPALVTRVRQRRCLEDAAAALSGYLEPGLPLEIAAEELRRAAAAIGRLSGRIDVEDVLGEIFGRFCIGK